MKVFISWSGERSRFIAEALRWWLPLVLQSVKPWMSDEDISAGSRWLLEVSNKLSDTHVGVICVTPENQNSPWLLFEAGALSKALEQSFVCPLLFDLQLGQLSGPLSQFQANTVGLEGVRNIVATLNRAQGETPLSAADVEEIVGVWWPRLEARLKDVPPLAAGGVRKIRTSEELLEEIVGNTREQLRRETIRLEATKEREAKLDMMLEMMNGALSVAQEMQSNTRSFTESLNRGGARSGKLAELALAAKKLRALPNADLSQMEKMLEFVKEEFSDQKGIVEKLLQPPNVNKDEKDQESR